MNKYLASYLRLSQDDNNFDESNSITNQREIIKEYIYSSDEFVESQTLEFVDDGYSGTNFNRPGIKALLEAVKKGEINCIIVKDFSRFGRSYLEVSKYIEQLFPYIGVRFIAVNDNYDSNSHKGTTAEIDVPIRNMINALYSIDISKKVKSTKRAKMKQGVLTSAFTIYGYKKDNVDKGHLLIDDPAAKVVRQIFQLILDGNTVSKVAEKLNKECIPTPSVYKNQTGNKKNWNNVYEKGSIWTSTNIFRILKEERYTGTFIGGMREISKIGSNKEILIPKEKWIRIPNNHPAIITQEQFDTINKMIHKYPTKIIKPKNISYKPLHKKIKCGKCGRLLHYRSDVSLPFYSCETSKYTDEYGCMHGKIREKELNKIVLDVLLTQTKLFIDNEKILRITKEKINQPNVSEDNSILQLDNEIMNMQANKRKLYERYKNGEINQAVHLQEREKLEDELTNKTTTRETLISQQQNHNNILESAQLLLQNFLKFQSSIELTKEIVDNFIESVKVYDVDRITIKFKFQDELKKIIEILQNNNV